MRSWAVVPRQSVPVKSVAMNQHVPRPGRSERTDHGLTLTDAQPLAGIPAVWRLAALVATVAMGMLALIGALYLGRSILLPVTAGLIVGITLSPAVQLGSKINIPQPVTALIVFALLICFLGLLLTFFAAPLTEWIGRAPEIGRVVQEKMRVLEYPMQVLRSIREALMPPSAPGQTVSVEANPAQVVGAVLIAITPAVSQFVLFFGTLIFFLATNTRIRRRLIVAFWTREARLRMIRIWNDIEENLVAYVGLVSLINLGLGAVTAAMLYAIGFPNPLTFGLLTLVLNYVPYIGPAIVAIVLFCIGMVAMSSLTYAALAPALFVLIATAEGHFITPSIVGRRLTLNPFVVFLALAFWTWLWGPIGAFLAVPLLIVSLVTLGHVFPREEGGLPD